MSPKGYIQAIKPYQTAEEFLGAVYTARLDDQRLRIVAKRIEHSENLLRHLTERDVALLVTIALADTGFESPLSTEEVEELDGNFTEHYQAIFKRKTEEDSSPLVPEEDLDPVESFMKSGRQAIEANRIGRGIAASFRSFFGAEYPELGFIISTSWGARLLYYLDDIRSDYKGIDPLLTISRYFGCYFYGEINDGNPDASPIPESCRDVLKGTVLSIISRSDQPLAEDFVLLCNIALGQKPVHDLISFLADLEDSEVCEIRSREWLHSIILEKKARYDSYLLPLDHVLQIPSSLKGYRINIALSILGRFLKTLPTSFTPEEEFDFETAGDDIKLISLFRSLLNPYILTLEECLEKNSDPKFTFSLEKAIKTNDLQLLASISHLCEASGQFLTELEEDLFHGPGDIEEDGDSELGEVEADQVLDQALQSVCALNGMKLTFQIDQLVHTYFRVAQHNSPDAPFLALGVHRPDANPDSAYRGSAATNVDIEASNLPFDTIGQIFAGDIVDPLASTHVAYQNNVIEVFSHLQEEGNEEVAACLLAMWLELQTICNGVVLPNPEVVARQSARLSPAGKAILHTAISRIARSPGAKKNKLLLACFPIASQRKLTILSPQESVMHHLGKSAWMLLDEQSKSELLLAEEAWFLLREHYMVRSSEDNDHALSPSFRAPFANWGPTLEREFSRVLSPVKDHLSDYDKSELSPYLQRISSGNAGLNDMINFIPTYNTNLKPRNKFDQLASAIRSSRLKTDIFDNQASRRKWQQLGELRNLAVHDGNRAPTWEDVVTARLFILQSHLLRDLVTIGHSHPIRI